MHNEKQPHRWSSMLNLHRSNLDINFGGSFFLPGYGIRIQQATNSCIAWEPKKAHGTGVPNVDPTNKNPYFKQLIAAFVTSPTLKAAWTKFIKKQMDKEAFNSFVDKMEEEVPYDHGEDEEYEEGYEEGEIDEDIGVDEDDEKDSDGEDGSSNSSSDSEMEDGELV